MFPVAVRVLGVAVPVVEGLLLVEPPVVEVVAPVGFAPVAVERVAIWWARPW